jgi:hypothetical protein
MVDTLAYLVPLELRQGSAAAPRPAGPPAVEAGGLPGPASRDVTANWNGTAHGGWLMSPELAHVRPRQALHRRPVLRANRKRFAHPEFFSV